MVTLGVRWRTRQKRGNGKPLTARQIAPIVRSVTCMVCEGHSHEIFSAVPTEIAEEVRTLVAALVAGTYYEEIRDKPRNTTTKAVWPGGGSSTLDITQDAGGPRPEWRKRAYDPY